MVERRRLTGIVPIVIGVLIGCTSQKTPVISPTPSAAWARVWSDEFDGPAGARIDTTVWHYDTGDGCSRGLCGWGNTEKEYYLSSPANIALNGNGQLMIVARRAQAELPCYYGRCLYSSAKVTTRGTMLAEPGRVEARIKLPRGQGLWPAFWMLGQRCLETRWPDCGEIDIMENKGSQPTTTSSAVHGPGYSNKTPFTHARAIARGNAEDFHTYAVEWDSVRVRFFIDDAAHYSVTRAAVAKYGRYVFDQPFYLILNLAVGGTFDGDPQSDAIFPATMLVDYVRVYKRQ
ncbi:MAG: family 16 glycosylhydrolase [Gemmatimonadaceae bacterium]